MKFKTYNEQLTQMWGDRKSNAETEKDRRRKQERERAEHGKRAPTGDAFDNKSAGNSINANALKIFYTISS